jgi:uncharacterized phage protein (TIGR01671 family)
VVRGIKFRVWYGEMDYIDDFYYFEEQGICEIVDGIGYGNHFICNVMQYTGLIDKNGKEIYEGDIIKDAGTVTGEVYWNKDHAGFFVKLTIPNVQESMKSFMNLHYPILDTPIIYVLKNFYVIGNKYENPEIIKN